MIKIAVCEDNKKDLKKIKGLLSKYKNTNPYCQIKIDYFLNPLKMLDYVEENGGFDLYFLGIIMEVMPGCKLSIELKRINKASDIIFTTTSKNHAIFAYQIEAIQYLLKPVTPPILYQTLDKYLSLKCVSNKYSIIFKTTKGIVKVNTREVVFSEPEKNNYQAIVLKDGCRHIVRITVSALYNLLSINPAIVRCGAALNINLSFVEEINKEVIIFENKVKLIYPYLAYKKLQLDFLSFQSK